MEARDLKFVLLIVVPRLGRLNCPAEEVFPGETDTPVTESSQLRSKATLSEEAYCTALDSQSSQLRILAYTPVF